MSDPVQNAVNTTVKTGRGVEAEWHPRTVNPPPGLVWATDYELVWLIYTDGVIPDNAFLVRAWTAAHIPQPPPKPLS